MECSSSVELCAVHVGEGKNNNEWRKKNPPQIACLNQSHDDYNQFHNLHTQNIGQTTRDLDLNVKYSNWLGFLSRALEQIIASCCNVMCTTIIIMK